MIISIYKHNKLIFNRTQINISNGLIYFIMRIKLILFIKLTCCSAQRFIFDLGNFEPSNKTT